MKKIVDQLAFSTDPVAFIVKRAFRRGYACPSDVVDATGISSASATRAMQSAQRDYASSLSRYKTRLVPRPVAAAPAFASEDALFAALDSGRNNPAITGLFPHELPVSYVRTGNPLPAQPGIFTLVTQAIADQAPLELIYLDLHRDGEPMVHTIYPVALERLEDQWRLLAQDYRSHGHLSVFVLSRILKATKSKRIRPAGFVAMNEQDATITVPVRINPRYTAQQEAVVAHEWAVDDGVVRLPSRARQAFAARLLTGGENDADIWPPLIAQ